MINHQCWAIHKIENTNKPFFFYPWKPELLIVKVQYTHIASFKGKQNYGTNLYQITNKFWNSLIIESAKIYYSPLLNLSLFSILFSNYSLWSLVGGMSEYILSLSHPHKMQNTFLVVHIQGLLLHVVDMSLLHVRICHLFNFRAQVFRAFVLETVFETRVSFSNLHCTSGNLLTSWNKTHTCFVVSKSCFKHGSPPPFFFSSSQLIVNQKISC